jgi:hypothetical protein
MLVKRLWPVDRRRGAPPLCCSLRNGTGPVSQSWLVRISMLSVALALAFGCDGLVEPEPEPEEPPVGWYGQRPFLDVDSLNDVVVLAPGRVFAVGSGGTIVRGAENVFSKEVSGVTVALESVAGALDDEGREIVLAVGGGGTVLTRGLDDGVWSVVPSGTTEHLFGLWLRTPTDAFIVGDSGTILRWNGTAVVAMTNESLQDVFGADGTLAGRFPIPEPLKAVMGTAANDVYAVGARGAAFRFNGTRWVRELTGTNRPLADVFIGDSGVLAATTDGVVLQRAGDGTWSDQALRAPAQVYLQGAFSLDGDVYAVGMVDQLLHFEDGGWTVTALDDESHMRAVHGISTITPDGRSVEVWAVGGGGRMARGPTTTPTGVETFLESAAFVEEP